MNKSISIILGIVTIIVIGLLVWWSLSKDDLAPTGTTTAPIVETTPTTSVITNSPSAPKTTTSQNSAPSDTSVVLSGKITPNGASTSYWYEYGTSANMDKRTTSQMIGSGFVELPTPAYITGLLANTTYYFRLSAQNQFGDSFGLQYSFKTTQGNPPPVGSVPTAKTLAASNVTRDSASLNAEVTPNRSTTWYWFEYGKTSNLGNITNIQTTGDGTNKLQVSTSLTNLETASTYYFRINTQNQFGTVNGSILNFKTLDSLSAAAPSVNTKNATGVNTASATLRGETNPNGLETTYWFEYSTDSLLGSVLLKTTSAKTLNASNNLAQVETDIAGLTSRTNYYFRLVSENDLGTSRGDSTLFKTK